MNVLAAYVCLVEPSPVVETPIDGTETNKTVIEPEIFASTPSTDKDLVKTEDTEIKDDKEGIVEEIVEGRKIFNDGNLQSAAAAA